MPSGAHTPVMFAKGGGNAMFSQNCVNLLSDVGFSPENFGSYSALSKQIKQERKDAKTTVRTLQAKAAAGGGLTPTEQSELDAALPIANQEVAHLGQNATKQRQRGNPCSNMVDGHNDADYPCVLLGGPARSNGQTNPDSEHGRQTLEEEAGARNAGTRDTQQSPGRRADARPPAEGSVYSADQMASDERARASGVCSDRASGSNSTTTAQDAGAMPAEPSARQRDSLAAYDAALNNRTRDGDDHPTSSIDGETAAECIDTFKKMGEAAMKKKMEEQADANAAKAGSPEQRAQAQAAVAAAEQREDDAGSALSSAQRERRNARRAASRHTDSVRSDPSHPQHEQWNNDRDAATSRLRDSESAVQTAEANVATADRESTNARTASSRLENANCRARQGRRLANGNPRTDGRVPYTPPATETSSGVTTGHEEL